VTKRELTQLFGKGKVLDAPEALEMYAKDESFAHPVRPRCVIKPTNTDEVQKIVSWANETVTPLVPVSSGSPHFRGDTVPSTGGAVMVDLGGMKKILRIDTENLIVMIEPGVTYGELIPELAKVGLRVNMPLLPRKSKSVVASVLEREPVIMPRYHWDIGDPIGCTEVIYGGGDLYRTGNACGVGTLEEQWEAGCAQNEAGGPIQADFYRLLQGAQGTMGIVTWATVVCERAPSIEEPFLVGADNVSDLLDFIHWLMRRRLVDDCFVLNSSDVAHMIAKDRDYGSVKETLPPWVLYYTVTGFKYFPEEKVNYRKEAIAKLAQSTHLDPARVIGMASAYEMMKLFHNPSEEPYWKMREKGSCHDIFFITIFDKLQDHINTMNSVAEKFGFPSSNMGVYVQPIVQGVNLHCEFNLFFDPHNPEESEKVQRISKAAFQALTDRGAFFSRPYGSWADMAYRRDAATTISLRKVKGIFDPRGIMNPGKLCF